MPHIGMQFRGYFTHGSTYYELSLNDQHNGVFATEDAAIEAALIWYNRYGWKDAHWTITSTGRRRKLRGRHGMVAINRYTMITGVAHIQELGWVHSP